MRISNDEVVIDDVADPFESALPGRKAFGDRLSALFEELEDTAVVALDGEWGTGKTTFLRRWVKAHQLKIAGKGRVIYFDAFEHEFLDDPLASLVAKLDAEIEDGSAAGMKKVTRAATRLLGPAVRIGLAAVSGGVSEVVGKPAADAVGKAASIGDAELDAAWKATTSRIRGVEEFTESLKALANGEDGGAGKLILVIDELDRCRPDYALQFLEVIKHFFAVPNVHFLLGVNMRSLRVSVEARYGRGIGADEYLRKFIHLTIGLPDMADGPGQVKSSIEYFEVLSEHDELPRNLESGVAQQLKILSAHREVSLRDVQQVVQKAQLLPADFNGFPWGVRDLLVTMVFMNFLEPDLFKKVLKGTIVLSEVTRFLSGEPDDQPKDPGDKRWIEKALGCWEMALMDKADRNDPQEDAYVHELARQVAGAFGDWSDDHLDFDLRKHARDYIMNWDTRPFER